MAKGFKDENNVFHPTGNNGGKKAPDDKSIIPTPSKKILFETEEDMEKAKAGDPRTLRKLNRRLSLTKEEQEENIANGRRIIDEFQQALDDRDDDFFQGKTINKWLENNSGDVVERLLENLGIDENQFREFLDNRLEKKKGVWNLAIPISTDGADEDILASNYSTKSNKARLFWGNVSPEDFLQLASEIGSFSEDTVKKRQEQIKNGEPISTPSLDLTWDDNQEQWKVRMHEGRHRAEASRRENLEKIPVWIETDISLWNMSEIQEMALKKEIDEGISRFSFISQ